LTACRQARVIDACLEAGVKKAEEVMEILEAFDLTGSLRAAAELAGCDHKTVGHWVRARDQAGGVLVVGARSRLVVGEFAGKVEELVDRSRGKIRADRAHEKLVAMGYVGSERTTRRAVALAKRRWRVEHGRRTRPWVPEPGLWMQWDYGDGPRVAGAGSVLFCAWLAWSRFRVVLALRDKTTASVVMALDRALRAFGGAPTYALTDNEKTVSVDHVCGIAVRNPQIVAVARHYGLTIATCVPADPQSKGGSEATVRIAKADLVPTDHNLRAGYDTFAELEEACEEFCQRVNAREHRVTRRAPVVMLAEERERLHALPGVAHTVCFGQTRKVGWQSTISVGGAVYSVPSQLIDERVWARSEGSELVVVHADGPDGPREVARHALTTPGRPAICDEHYPPRPAGALERRPRAQNIEEQAFLALGPGAEAWLVRAAAAGAQRVRRKIAEAVDLAKLHGSGEVDHALSVCAGAGRFGDGDLASVLAHQQAATVIPFPARASEENSLQSSTRTWEGFGR
jgi:transposase